MTTYFEANAAESLRLHKRSKRERAAAFSSMSSSHVSTGLMARAKRVLAAALAVMCVTANAGASTKQDVPDVTTMSVEDLMNIQVTSVAKRSQKVGDAAAAVFVITADDIERSGARSIPELLRMVPGLQVARIDENKWAIGSRGFNGRFDDKLLVLIDGRSVYTPLFSGVYWDVEDVMLEDVARIEVIRGPGATLYGANAVDGVINIITKTAKETQSGLIKAEGGDEQLTTDSVRYGGKAGNAGYYRAYLKGFDWDSSTGMTGADANDGWHQTRGGFRSDWTLSRADSLTVQGDVYKSTDGETLTVPTLNAPFYSATYANEGIYSGGNLLSRWNHNFLKGSITLQTYFDRTNYADNHLFVDHESVYDVDFQHDFRLGEKNEILWGAGYRSIQDRNDGTFAVSVTPSQGDYNQFSAFGQDEISLLNKRLRLTLGSKFEHNAFTGFEIEPNVRFVASVSKNQSVWGAISRAVRTPAITEEGLNLVDAVVPPGYAPNPSPTTPLLESVFGSSQFKSEDLLAYEVGYRVQATSSFSADISAFYNNYTNLRSAEPGQAFADGSTANVQPFYAENKMSGGTYGIEPFVDWKVLPYWKLFASYTYLEMNIHKNADSIDPTPDIPNGSNPKNQWYLRSSLDLPHHITQDLSVRYVDSLPGIGIPSYYSMDAGIRWSPMTNVVLAFNGQNWLDSRHLEFTPDFINTVPTVLSRTMYGSITVNFGKR